MTRYLLVCMVIYHGVRIAAVVTATIAAAAPLGWALTRHHKDT